MEDCVRGSGIPSGSRHHALLALFSRYMALTTILLVAFLGIAPPPEIQDAPAPQPLAQIESAGTAPFGSLSTPRFRLVYTRRAEGAARFLSQRIEALRSDLVTLLGRDWPGTTEIRLGFGRQEYEALAMEGGSPPSWAVALAYPQFNTVLVEAHSLIQGDGQETLRHELVHVALGQLGRTWPRWFQEGLAQELTGERAFRLTQYAALARAVSMDRLFHFEDLSDGFPSDPTDVETAYAQSAAFVSYLRTQHGTRAFAALIDSMTTGAPFETAFGIAFHSSLSVEENRFREGLPNLYPWWPLVLAGGTALWALMSMLMIAAFLQRRRQFAARRAEMMRIEHLEELAHLLTDATSSAHNEDGASDTAPTPSSHHDWLVTSIQRLRVSKDRPGEAQAPPALGTGGPRAD